MLLVGQRRHNQWFLVLGQQKRRWVVVLLLSLVLWVPEGPLLWAQLFPWQEVFLPEGATDGNLVRYDERAPLPVGAQRAADPVLRGDAGAGAGIGLGAAQAAGANPPSAPNAAVTSQLSFSALSPSTPLPTVGEALLYKQFNAWYIMRWLQ